MTIKKQNQEKPIKENNDKFDYRLAEEANQDYKESLCDPDRIQGTNK